MCCNFLVLETRSFCESWAGLVTFLTQPAKCCNYRLLSPHLALLLLPNIFLSKSLEFTATTFRKGQGYRKGWGTDLFPHCSAVLVNSKPKNHFILQYLKTKFLKYILLSQNYILWHNLKLLIMILKILAKGGWEMAHHKHEDIIGITPVSKLVWCGDYICNPTAEGVSRTPWAPGQQN